MFRRTSEVVNGKNINLSSITDSDGQQIERQLSRILSSSQFKSASQMQRFLKFIVHQALAGKEKNLKQYTIAVDALGFADDFDSDSNPSVRILGGRVRDRLKKYYSEEGMEDELLIEIPKGSYIPYFKKKSADNNSITIDIPGEGSQGPKLGLFCFENDAHCKESNNLIVQITSTLAKELSHFIFSRLYVQIPFLGQTRSDLIGQKAKSKYKIDFTLFLFIQELPNKKYELVYRLWDNDSEEVIDSEIYDVSSDQTEKQRNHILNKISAVVADIYQGQLHTYWARKLLKSESTIPEHYQTLAYYRHYADNLGKSSFEKSVSYCTKAIERDPKDTIAYVIFADYCRRDYVYGFNFIDDPLEKGKEYAETAIRLRPDSHEAHFAFGQILFCLNEWDRSTEEFNLARNICKNHVVVEYGTGFHFCLMGQWKEGLLLVKKAMELSDSYPAWYHLTPFLNYYRKEKYEEALIEAEKISTPNLLHGPLARCAVYGQLGETEKAQKELQDLLIRCPDFLGTGEQTLARFLGTKELAEKLWKGISKILK